MPVVAVVGRPNVGKSTFFNRILGRRIAIVDETPGVTRDRNFARAEWAGRSFFIVDTGGMIEGSRELLDRAIREQALAAVEEADLIVFVVDAKAGIHPLDQQIAELLRPTGRPVLLVANKVDNHPRDDSHHDFWRLGMGEPVPVSAISGRGSGDALDELVARLPEPLSEEGENGEVIRVAVVGKPNVGKSSFVNRLFGEDRMVVSDVPGTTRDPVDSPLRYHGRDLVFVDTAGLRRQSRIKDSLEYYSSLRTARVVREADVCLVLVDGFEGVHHQDVRIVHTAWEAGCGVILAVNKWDLVEKDERTAPTLQKDLQARVPELKWAPFLFVSALTGQRVRTTLDQIMEVAAERERRIPTHVVNQTLQTLVQRQPPPHSRGRPVKIRYGTQVSVRPPAFAIFSNFPSEIPDHYVRYIHNEFRKAWGFSGSPIRIFLRESSPRRGAPS